MGQGARKVPRQFPLIFRISNRSQFSVVPCQRGRVRVGWSQGLAGRPGHQMAVSKFSDLEYRMAEIEEQLSQRTGHNEANSSDENESVNSECRAMAVASVR